MPDDTASLAELLTSAGTPTDLALVLVEHEGSLNTPELSQALRSSATPAASRADETLREVRSRGLEAVLAQLCPVPGDVAEAVDALLAEDFRGGLAALRKYFALLTSTAAAVQMRLLVAGHKEHDQKHSDASSFLAAARRDGRAGARVWTYSELFRQATFPVAMISAGAVRQIIVIPLEEGTLDPLTEEQWLELVCRYRDLVGVDVDYDWGLRFFIDAEPMCRQAPVTMRVEVMAALGRLFMNRPPGPGSDRAQSIEEAIQVLTEAVEETHLAQPPYTDARLHHFLARAYMSRLDFDPLQHLLDARHHFEAALQLANRSRVAIDLDDLRLDLARCCIEVGQMAFDRNERREALHQSLILLRPGASRGRPYETMELAYALSLNAEFDESLLAKAIQLIEPLLESRTGEPGGVFVQQEYLEHTVDTQRWAWARYHYAQVVLQARGLGHDCDLTRAIDEMRGAAPLFDSLALSGEVVGGWELVGDLLCADGGWDAALAAFDHATVAFPYLPHTLLGRESALTRAAALGAKRAFCLARQGDLKNAVLTSEQYRTGSLLLDLELTRLATNAKSKPVGARLTRALRVLRQTEMRARLPHDVELRPSEVELGHALAEARRRMEEATGAAALDFRTITAVDIADLESVVVDGTVLVMALCVPCGGALVGVTRREDGLRYAARFNNLDSRRLRDLLGYYLELLRVMQSAEKLRCDALLAKLAQELQREVGDDLSDLLDEIELPSDTEVRFVSGAGIGSLPINTLCRRGSAHALIDDVAVTVMPGLSLAARLGKFNSTSHKSGRVLIVADPMEDLPFAQLEAALIRAHTGARLLTGAKATRSRVKKRLTPTRALHVAGHATADVDVPWRSGLQLADGLLTAAEIIEGANGTLQTATLSGCETGFTGASRAPQEREGLTGALMVAGCSTVIASWWPVDDLASCIVTSETYRMAHEQSVPLTEALRRVESWLKSASRDELLNWCDNQNQHLVIKDRTDRKAHQALRAARDLLSARDAVKPPFGSILHWAGFYSIHAAGPRTEVSA